MHLNVMNIVWQPNSRVTTRMPSHRPGWIAPAAAGPWPPTLQARRVQTRHRSSLGIQSPPPAGRLLGACRSTAGRGGGEGGDANQRPFFNRELEIAAIEKSLSSSPTHVLLITGPSNSGKTALLEEVMARRAAVQAAAGEEAPSTLHLDCRAADVSTPDALATYLAEMTTGTTVSTTLTATISAALGAVKAELEGGVTNAFTKSALRNVLDIYGGVLRECAPRHPKPVFIIDEANELMDWKEAAPRLMQLRHFINFLIVVTKQAGLAHVVLATSDCSLAFWLAEKGLGYDNYIQFVVGNLLEADARRYVCDGGDWPGIIKEFPGAPPLDDETWAAVYAGCGGNIGFLRRCCNLASVAGSWEEGLADVMHAPGAEVRSGLEPEFLPLRAKPPAWTPEQYKAVLRAIVGAKHHAVLFSAPIPGVTNAALMSMVEYNLLARRPYSWWAQDVPLEAFGGKNRAFVATLPSAAALQCAFDMERCGELAESAPEKGRQDSGKKAG